MYTTLPSESTFSRAFEAFATSCLAERVHESLIKEHLAGEIIGHISRDGTAIPAPERPIKSKSAGAESAPKAKPAKRGCPRRGEVRPAPQQSTVQIQRKQTLEQMRQDIPLGADEPAARKRALRRDGCGLLQQRFARAQPAVWLTSPGLITTHAGARRLSFAPPGLFGTTSARWLSAAMPDSRMSLVLGTGCSKVPAK